MNDYDATRDVIIFLVIVLFAITVPEHINCPHGDCDLPW